ncbi:MAG: Ricin-type beta-trefoil lectin domain-like [Rariglobus sp.]|jgi:hypothetical protein|nr:Ricin-type beta-trefoil lectin domain-like [Rariglobus sp.]
MRSLSALAAGLVLACLQAGALHAQPTGSNRLYHGSSTQLYLERPSLADWSAAANYTWSATSGGGVWEITALGGGLYRLDSGGKALTRDGTADWSVVKTAAYSGWSTQKWSIIANGDGSWRIENSGKALTGNSGSGSSVMIATYSGWTTQKWHAFTENKTGWPAGNWKWVYRNVGLSSLLLIDKSDTLVINSTIQGVANSPGVTKALAVSGASNVYIKWTDILDVTADRGLVILNSSNVTVDDCLLSNHVRPSAVHSSFLLIDSSPNVTIRATTVQNCDGNGILTAGATATNLLVDGCTITNTGRVPYSASAPFHSIYSKAPDVTYTNNTITDSLDGSAISMRSTGTLTGNQLSSAKHSLIAYWPDASAGASAALVVTGNVFEQDNYDYTGGTSKAALVGLNDNGNPNGIAGAYFQTYRIENNQMRTGTGCASADALVTANWPVGSPGFGDVRATGNTLTDQRAVKTYFGNASRFAATTPNTLQ